MDWSRFLTILLYKICQNAWEMWVNSSFKVQPQILSWIYFWPLMWPTRNINIVLKHCCWENKSPLKLVILQTASSFPPGFPYILLYSFTFTRLTRPTAEKHPHSMGLPPSCFTVGTVCLWNWTFSHIACIDSTMLFINLFVEFSWCSFWPGLVTEPCIYTTISFTALRWSPFTVRLLKPTGCSSDDLD